MNRSRQRRLGGAPRPTRHAKRELPSHRTIPARSEMRCACQRARSLRGRRVGGCNARENGPVRYHHLRPGDRQSSALPPGLVGTPKLSSFFARFATKPSAAQTPSARVQHRRSGLERSQHVLIGEAKLGGTDGKLTVSSGVGTEGLICTRLCCVRTRGADLKGRKALPALSTSHERHHRQGGQDDPPLDDLVW